MSTTATATPTTESKVCAHFLKYPDDELDCADIAQQFGVKATQVDALLASAVAAGRLNRVVRNRLAVYLAGPLLARAQAPAAPPPAPPAMPAKAKRKLPPPIPDDALTAVEEGVPAPPHAKTGMKRTNWHVLFERLKPGLCSCPLPIAHIGAAKAAAKKYSKEQGGTYRVAAISDTHMRIWRTE
jgi:hypothetical protein